MSQRSGAADTRFRTSLLAQMPHSLANTSVVTGEPAGTVYGIQANPNQEENTMSNTLVVNPVARTTNVVRYRPQQTAQQPAQQQGTVTVPAPR